MGDLSPEENERLLAVLRQVLNERYDGNITQLAKAMGRSQPALSAMLSGKGGASLETARRLASVVRMDVWEMMGTAPSGSEQDEYPSRAKAIAAARTLGTISEEAIAHVQGLDYYSKVADSISPDEWLDKIREADRDFRRGILPSQFRGREEDPMVAPEPPINKAIDERERTIKRGRKI